MDDSTKVELAKLIVEGKKIPAIKLYRESTGMGLKKAKEAVEELEREMREAAPEKFSENAAGCSPDVAAWLIGVSGLVYWLF